jgi:hypothetical protein
MARKADFVASYTVDAETYNKIKSKQQTKKSNHQPPTAKRKRTTGDLMDEVYKQASTSENQPLELALKNQCSVCFKPPNEPHSTNCPCERMGCKKCLGVFNQTDCAFCDTKLKAKQYKQLFFGQPDKPNLKPNNPFAKKKN